VTILSIDANNIRIHLLVFVSVPGETARQGQPPSYVLTVFVSVPGETARQGQPRYWCPVPKDVGSLLYIFMFRAYVVFVERFVLDIVGLHNICITEVNYVTLYFDTETVREIALGMASLSVAQ
jgi:hypothetical protein